MKRRAVLALLAGGMAGGCMRSLPGATGPRRPPDAPSGRLLESSGGLDVTNWDYSEASDGRLRVSGSVENTGRVESTATVLVKVTVEGEDYTRSTEVSVPPGGTTSFDLVFEPTYDAFIRRGSITVELV